VPDLWAAGAALSGSPKAAIDSNVFGEFHQRPGLWISSDDSKPMVEKLTAAKLNVEWRVGIGQRQRGRPFSGWGSTSAMRSPLHRLRDQLARVFPLLLDTA
jgi:hypothetical protein